MVKFYQRLGLGGLYLLVSLGLMALVASLHFSQAAANTGGAANTLKMSPVRTDITVETGESQTVRVTVTNLTDQSITVRPVANDFIAGDEQGTPALILNDDDYAPSRSLKRFMEPMDDLALQPGEAKTVNVIVNVPKNSQAGGYFGAIRFMPTSPDGGGQVNLSPSVASLILLKVPGEVDEKLTMTNFSVQQNGKPARFFTNSEDLSTLVRFVSDSGVQLDPVGKVYVQKGDTVVYEADFNNKNPRDTILPDSARRWEVPLQGIGGFGRYTVSATFTYGQKNQTIDAEQGFWVIPVSMIIVAIAILVGLVGMVVAGWFFIRGRRRSSIKARRSGGLRL